MRPCLIVPTLGNRADKLGPLLAAASMPTVVVRTDGVEDPYPGADWTLHEGGRNIHRWWLAGITHAVEHGATRVVIANDDIEAGRFALLQLADTIRPGTVLAWPSDPPHAALRPTPITGYCFALDPAMVLPNPEYQWWWGEHDLELRARALYGDDAVKAVEGLPIRHLRVGWEYDRPVGDLIEADRALFAAQHPGHAS